MRILITCHELVNRAGSELYTRDLALALRRSGFEVVAYAPKLGAVAAEIREGGVATIDNLDQMGAPPDLIHGQHHLQAMAAITRFPSTPAVFVCHGWLPWEEAPPLFPSIHRYIAVDALRRQRLIDEHGIPPENVMVLYNFVDLERFPTRAEPLPANPGKALLFSNHAGANHFSTVVAETCAGLGVELETVGMASGRPVSRPELLLPDFDIVFARGRSALEAMAVGAAVVLYDIEGDGPLVSTKNFDRLRAMNFGVGALKRPIEPERLRESIASYDPEDAARVSVMVREHCGLDSAVSELIATYDQVMSKADAGQPPVMGTEAVSRYIEWLGPYMKHQVEILMENMVRETREVSERRVAESTELRRLLDLVVFEHGDAITEIRDRFAGFVDASGELGSLIHELRELRQNEATLYRERAERAEADRQQAMQELTSAVARLAQAEERLESTAEALRVLENSPFSRLRARLLQSGALVATYRLLSRQRVDSGPDSSSEPV